MIEDASRETRVLICRGPLVLPAERSTTCPGPYISSSAPKVVSARNSLHESTTRMASFCWRHRETISGADFWHRTGPHWVPSFKDSEHDNLFVVGVQGAQWSSADRKSEPRVCCSVDGSDSRPNLSLLAQPPAPEILLSPRLTPAQYDDVDDSLRQ